jgi:hypothetical protein
LPESREGFPTELSHSDEEKCMKWEAILCSDLTRILVKIQCLKECAHRSCMQPLLSAGTHVCYDQEDPMVFIKGSKSGD